MLNATIQQAMQQKGGVITTSEIQSLGFSRTMLTKYVKNGQLDRVAHGLYMLPGEIEDDMYTIMLRSEKVIFSHESALFLHGFSDRTPFMHSVTIPSNAAIPQTLKNNCTFYYIKPKLYLMGITEQKTTFGHTVRCYDLERTICDLLRSRSRCDEETVLSAIKRYAAYKGKNLNVLSEYATKLSVRNEIKKYMEVLL